MEKRIRLGIVGLGRAGRTMHMSELKGKEDMIKVVAVCDIEEDRRNAFAEEFGAKTYYKIEDMVGDPDIDVIDIATRSCDHFIHAKTALEAGKIVFLEKPITMTYEQARELMDVSKKLEKKYGSRRLYVRHNRRFEAMFMQVNEIIESGILGDVYYVKRATGNYSLRHDWQTLSQYGGGQLLNWGPHLVDQALQFCGGDYTKMFADIRQIAASGDCEDVVNASFVGVNGRLVEILISGATAISPPAYIVYGSRGALIDIDKKKFKIKYVEPGHEIEHPEADIHTPAGARFAPDIQLPFIEEEREWETNKLDHTWTYLYESVVLGKEFPISNEEALKVMQTIDEIRMTGKII
ncbi:MAG: Gfo/Idh/MocA family oxidoreductase [Ruminococcaceae bacterium]|nr:Gfo/Idh/MocA family oxidoreductase [Oscillospiraceae bacterium]